MSKVEFHTLSKGSYEGMKGTVVHVHLNGELCQEERNGFQKNGGR